MKKEEEENIIIIKKPFESTIHIRTSNPCACNIMEFLLYQQKKNIFFSKLILQFANDNQI